MSPVSAKLSVSATFTNILIACQRSIHSPKRSRFQDLKGLEPKPQEPLTGDHAIGERQAWEMRSISAQASSDSPARSARCSVSRQGFNASDRATDVLKSKLDPRLAMSISAPVMPRARPVFFFLKQCLALVGSRESQFY